LHADLQ